MADRADFARPTVSGGTADRSAMKTAYAEAVGAHEALSKVMDDLEDRLGPVLQPAEGPRPVPEAAPAPPAAPVTGEFRELTLRIAVSRTRLQTLIERLEC